MATNIFLRPARRGERYQFSAMSSRRRFANESFLQAPQPWAAAQTVRGREISRSLCSGMADLPELKVRIFACANGQGEVPRTPRYYAAWLACTIFSETGFRGRRRDSLRRYIGFPGMTVCHVVYRGSTPTSLAQASFRPIAKWHAQRGGNDRCQRCSSKRMEVLCSREVTRRRAVYHTSM